MAGAYIKAVRAHLPSVEVTNSYLERRFPGFTADKILAKTGIEKRYVAEEGEFSTDLARRACEKLFESSAIDPSKIDALLVCTQTPETLIPTTACKLQDTLGLPREIFALDYNLGCSGYVYGLSLASSLIASGQAKQVLLVTADTYSKIIDPEDRSVVSIFGDAGSATWIAGVEGDADGISGFVFGTDGSGADHLACGYGLKGRGDSHELALRMNGPEIFNFTLGVVPRSVKESLSKLGLGLEDIDLFVLHQANAFMLEHLRKKIGIPEEKFLVAMRNTGNTVSTSIPMALREAELQGKLRSGMRILLAGFGVGLSWAACVVRWL